MVFVRQRRPRKGMSKDQVSQRFRLLFYPFPKVLVQKFVAKVRDNLLRVAFSVLANKIEDD
jgi:hypothetical protein